MTIDPATAFYQAMMGMSFTLLGIWFAVIQFGHGGWRDEDRHRSTLHIALHFFLPGTASMIAVLGAGTAGGMIWRVAFVIVGLVGTVESLLFLRAPGGPVAPAGRTLRALDPVLYLAVAAGTLIAPDQFVIAPLQIEGLLNGALFTVGLVYVWLAFAERQIDDPVAQP